MIRLLEVLTFVICAAVLSAYLLVRAGQSGSRPKRDQLYEAARWPAPLDSEEARRNRLVVLTLAILAATMGGTLLLGWISVRALSACLKPAVTTTMCPSEAGEGAES